MTHGDKPRLSPAPPILDNKNSALPSVFSPTALLREAHRQKGIAKIDVPEICLLDPDGDIVRALMRNGNANSLKVGHYHTTPYTTTIAGRTVGIFGCAVGALFAVLVAEGLFVSGCRLLLSLSSAGQISRIAAIFCNH